MTEERISQIAFDMTRKRYDMIQNLDNNGRWECMDPEDQKLADEFEIGVKMGMRKILEAILGLTKGEKI